jgi:group II intron reverse transcriptase/maturase
MSLATPSCVQELQRKLYRKSKAEPDYRFYTLWDKACRKDVLEEAWRRVKANKGAGGIDGETIAAVQAAGVDGFLSKLADDLKTGAYRPMPVRRVWIPKASGGKRPLGIPAVRDRVAQMAVKMVVEPILEADFRDCSYGFRPKRGAHDAVREVVKFLNWGLVNVVDADIRDFFGQIPHDKLMRVVARRIADGRVLRVLKAWLSCGVMEEGRVRAQTIGTPQGGVISPLLANAYLNELDAHWEKTGYTERRGWNAHLVRYADDLVILTDGDAAKPLDVLRERLSGLGLELHPDKTRLVNADKGSFDFLGFNFRKVWNRTKTKRFALFIPSRKAEASIRDKVRVLTRYERTVKLEQVIHEINPVIRGWVNYFKVGNSSNAFHGIREYIVKKSMRYLRRKQLRKGFGWKTLTSDVLYGRYGLFYDYELAWVVGGGRSC